MTGIYILWQAFLGQDHGRPVAAEIIERFAPDLDDFSVVGFAVRLLTSNRIEWTLDELVALVDERRHELSRGRGQPLPERMDAALLVTAAVKLWDAGRVDEGLVLVSDAVESLPGNEDLIAMEAAAIQGERPAIDLLEFVVGRNLVDADGEAASRGATAGTNGATGSDKP